MRKICKKCGSMLVAERVHISPNTEERFNLENFYDIPAQFCLTCMDNTQIINSSDRVRLNTTVRYFAGQETYKYLKEKNMSKEEINEYWEECYESDNGTAFSREFDTLEEKHAFEQGLEASNGWDEIIILE